MNRSRLVTAFAALAVLMMTAGGAAPIVAKEYNKRPHLAPQQRAKVDRTISRSRILGAQDGEGGNPVQDRTNVGCGSLEVGTVKVERGARAPRENIVVTGDVINVVRGCRRR